MTDVEIQGMLKQNLGIMHDAQDNYLTFLINSAKKNIQETGITLDLDEADDVNLVIMYAAYLFRKRAEDNPVMPRMLQFALHNRLFSEKMKP
jgi:hypothetical protein